MTVRELVRDLQYLIDRENAGDLEVRILDRYYGETKLSIVELQRGYEDVDENIIDTVLLR